MSFPGIASPNSVIRLSLSLLFSSQALPSFNFGFNFHVGGGPYANILNALALAVCHWLWVAAPTPVISSIRIEQIVAEAPRKVIDCHIVYC